MTVRLGDGYGVMWIRYNSHFIMGWGRAVQDGFAAVIEAQMDNHIS